MGKRSNLIVTLGLAVFIVGAAATYLVVRNSDDGSSPPAPARSPSWSPPSRSPPGPPAPRRQRRPGEDQGDRRRRPSRPPP